AIESIYGTKISKIKECFIMAKEILTTDNIELNVAFSTKEEAIRHTGDILVKNGYVETSYVEKMLEREELTSTFMWNYVAIQIGAIESIYGTKISKIKECFIMAKEILTTDNIELNVAFSTKEEAIRHTGDILVKNGYVETSYVEKMLEREELTSTFMGNYVAI